MARPVLWFPDCSPTALNLWLFNFTLATPLFNVMLQFAFWASPKCTTLLGWHTHNVLQLLSRMFWWQRQSTHVENSLDEKRLPAPNLNNKSGQIPCFELLERLNWPDFQTDLASYTSLLRLCGSRNSLYDGKHVHQHIVQTRHEQNPFLGNLLIEMYGNCGALEDAHAVFTKACQRNVFSWTFLVGAYTQNGFAKRALELLDQMQHESCMPDKVLFTGIVSACATKECFMEGKQVHARIVGSPFSSDVIMSTSMINMYGKCGQIRDAQRVFNAITEQDVVSWNAMIGAYVQHGHGKGALCLYKQMQWEGMLPNKSTFVSVLSVCFSQADLPEGKRMHVRIIHCGMESDVVLWNAIIAAEVQNGLANNAFQFFYKMQLEGDVPNRVTFVSVLQACASEAALVHGKQMHACIRDVGYESDLVVGNALVSMYSKCGSLEDAQKVFDKIVDKDVVSWSAIIAAYTQNGQAMYVLQIFNQMQQERVVPNELTLLSIVSAYANLSALPECKKMHASLTMSDCTSCVSVGNALISMYGKCGNLEDAYRLFDLMAEKDTVPWNAIISAYAQNGHGKYALQILDQMLIEGVIPNKVTFINTLSVCADRVDLLRGKRVHTQIVSHRVEMDDILENAILNMYGKCGVMDDAYKIFNKMAQPNLISWNSTIAGCSQHGQGVCAIQLFKEMQQEGIMPDESTFISLLSACSHAGLVDEGHEFVRLINQEYGLLLTIDHFNCMIDLFGRSGLLAEAEDLVNNMPFQPTSVSWTSLLNVCQHQLDVKRGEHAAKHMFELVPEDTASSVVLSNIYAVVDRNDGFANIRGAGKPKLEGANWLYMKLVEAKVHQQVSSQTHRSEYA